MGSTTAKAVGSNNSFDLDKETVKPKSSNIPRVLNTTTPLTDTLAPGEGAQANIAPVAADMAISSRDEQTRDELLSQNSAEESDEDAGGKILLPGRCIGVDTIKNLRPSGEKVQARPFRREESTGHGRHLLAGHNVSKDVTSLGERRAHQQEENQPEEYTPENIIESLQVQLAEKDAQLAEKEVLLVALSQKTERQEGRRGERTVEENPEVMYTQHRQMMEDCHRLHKVEEDAKKLREELETIKKEKEDRETQVMQLTTRLSLYEQSRGEGRGPHATSEVDTAALKERIATLTRELQRSEANVKKLKDHVNRVTRPTEVGEGGGEGLEMVKEGFRAEHLASLYEDAKQKDELITQQAREQEELRGLEKKKVVELYQEIKERDAIIEKQVEKSETVTKNMAALITYNQTANTTIKSLKEKCNQLEVRIFSLS